MLRTGLSMGSLTGLRSAVCAPAALFWDQTDELLEPVAGSLVVFPCPSFGGY